MAASAEQTKASPEEGASEVGGPSFLSYRGAGMPREPAGYQVQPPCCRHPGAGVLGVVASAVGIAAVRSCWRGRLGERILRQAWWRWRQGRRESEQNPHHPWHTHFKPHSKGME